MIRAAASRALVYATGALVLAAQVAAQAPDSAARTEWHRIPGWVSITVNTARAYSRDAGPVWAGRGLTGALSGGIAGHYGRLSFALQPVAFWTQNAAYTPSRTITAAGFNDPWLNQLDRPYRMGDGWYARVDAGDSYIRYGGRSVGVGLSNSPQVWGPARLNPLLMSGNAGGFPHAYLETARPANVGVGRVSARWMAGRLSPSGFGPQHAGTSARTLVGLVGSFAPRGLTGLEIGGARVFHLYESAVSYDFESLTLPVSALLKNRVRASDDPRRETNQLASVFARLAPPRSGIELYGEFLRDDHSVDLRDFTGEPDHEAAYVLGFRRRWSRGDTVSTTLTAERVNARLSHIARVRSQAPIYTHGTVLEGHTHRGLTLGSPMVPGGGGWTLSVERRRGASSWRLQTAYVAVAQNGEGGTFSGDPTGYLSISAERGFNRGGTPWGTAIDVQPAFGDLRSANLTLSVRRTLTGFASRD